MKTDRRDREKKVLGTESFGSNLLSDGDGYGEIIPSLFAWMPPEEVRDRAREMERITDNLSAAYRQQQRRRKGNGQGEK